MMRARLIPSIPACFQVLAVLALALLSQPAAAADYVIQVSVDGLRGDFLATLLAQDSTHSLIGFQRFVAEGATTFNARADYGVTVTLPNHTTMITGRPVTRPDGQPATVHHGYIWNSDPATATTLHNSGNLAVPYKASVFDVAHDAGLSTALYASKSKFVLFDRSYNETNGVPDSVPPDFGRDKLGRYVSMSTGVPATAVNLNAVLISELRTNPPRYSFVHYVDLDAVGHAYGWESAAYVASVHNVDGYLRDVLATVDSVPALAGKTVVLITADHGGFGFDHSDPTLPADYTIPFLAWGEGVARGADLYALNAVTRADPGTARPDYNAMPPPIRNGEAANLALQLLGLGPVPGSLINWGQDLVLSGPSAVQPANWSTVKSRYR
jgi:hypothetical protein